MARQWRDHLLLAATTWSRIRPDPRCSIQAWEQSAWTRLQIGGLIVTGAGGIGAQRQVSRTDSDHRTAEE